jgi:hypothetical protein
VAPAEIVEPPAVTLPAAEAVAAAGPDIIDPPTEAPAAAEPAATAGPGIIEPTVETPPAAETATAAAAELLKAPADEPPSAESAVLTEEAAPVSEAAPAIAEPAPTPESETVASAPALEPVAALASEPEPTPAPEPYAIPKFLATECASREFEHPDSLIPLRTAVAACALVGAVLLIYFGNSQEFGLAARPLAGPIELSQAHVPAPPLPPSVAVRQAFVAAPPVYSAASEPVRSYRPPFVGFDFLDTAAPPPTSVKAETSAAPPQAALVVPQASPEETASPPPAAGSDVTALIKRGDALLKAGDIAAARSAYERAAASGDAKAQIGVGKTYDPLVLSKLGARGVRGDPVQAASWYARAGEAGDAEGQQRLHALISGLSDCMLSQGACATRKP